MIEQAAAWLLQGCLSQENAPCHVRVFTCCASAPDVVCRTRRRRQPRRGARRCGLSRRLLRLPRQSDGMPPAPPLVPLRRSRRQRLSIAAQRRSAWPPGTLLSGGCRPRKRSGCSSSSGRRRRGCRRSSGGGGTHWSGNARWVLDQGRLMGAWFAVVMGKCITNQHSSAMVPACGLTEPHAWRAALPFNSAEPSACIAQTAWLTRPNHPPSLRPGAAACRA